MHHPPPPVASLGGGFKSIQGATTWNPTGTLRDKWVLNFHEDSRRGWHTKCVGGILATHNNIINSSSIVCLLRASNNSSGGGRDTKTIMVAGWQTTHSTPLLRSMLGRSDPAIDSETTDSHSSSSSTSPRTATYAQEQISMPIHSTRPHCSSACLGGVLFDMNSVNLPNSP